MFDNTNVRLPFRPVNPPPTRSIAPQRAPAEASLCAQSIPMGAPPGNLGDTFPRAVIHRPTYGISRDPTPGC